MSFIKNRSFSFKIVSLNVVSLILIAVSISLTIFFLLNRQMENYAIASQQLNMRVAWSVVKQKGMDFRVAEGKLFLGDYAVNGNFDVVDTIKNLMGGTATIFMEDTRISTNVLKADGSRAIGTKLGPGPVTDAVLGRGQPYRGIANILGETYLTAYDPIKNSAGEVVGVLYVGIKKSDFFSIIDQLLFNISAIVLGVTLLLSGVTYRIIHQRSPPPYWWRTGTDSGDGPADRPRRFNRAVYRHPAGIRHLCRHARHGRAVESDGEPSHPVHCASGHRRH